MFEACVEPVRAAADERNHKAEGDVGADDLRRRAALSC